MSIFYQVGLISREIKDQIMVDVISYFGLLPVYIYFIKFISYNNRQQTDFYFYFFVFFNFFLLLNIIISYITANSLKNTLILSRYVSINQCNLNASPKNTSMENLFTINPTVIIPTTNTLSKRDSPKSQL